MAHTDQLTAQQIAECEAIDFDWNQFCIQKLRQVSRDATQQRQAIAIARIASLPKGAQDAILAVTTAAIDAEVSKIPPEKK